MDVRDTQIADSWVGVVGSGPPLIVIHGGPGLEHGYLLPWLLPLADKHTLYFYDQRGCGRDRTPPGKVTVAALHGQLETIARALSDKGSLSLFAHSWGAYLVYELVNRMRDIEIEAFIALSPIGLTRERFRASGERIVSRVPEEVIEGLPELAGRGDDGRSVMEALAPFYQADPTNPVDVHFRSYREEVYQQIDGHLEAFDYRDIGPTLPAKTLLLYGDQDVELPEETSEVHPFVRVRTLEQCGHFGFAERTGDFLGAMRTFLSNGT